MSMLTSDPSGDRSPPSLSPAGSWRTAAGGSLNAPSRRRVSGISPRFVTTPRFGNQVATRRDSAMTQPPSDSEDEVAFPVNMIDGINAANEADFVSTLHSPVSPRPPRASRRFLSASANSNNGDRPLPGGNDDNGSPFMSRAASYANMAQFAREGSMVILTDDDEELEHVTHVEDRRYALQAVAARREQVEVMRRSTAGIDVAPPTPQLVVGNTSFIGGNTSFAAGNTSFAGGNASFAGGNQSFAATSLTHHHQEAALPGQIVTPAQTPAQGPAAPPALEGMEPLSSLLPMPAGARAELFHQLPPDVTPPQTALFIQRRAQLMNQLHQQHHHLTHPSSPQAQPRPVPTATPPPMPLARSGSNSHVNSARTQPLSSFNMLAPDESPRRNNGRNDDRPYFHPATSHMANSLMSDVESEHRQDKISVSGETHSLRVTNSFQARRRLAVATPTRPKQPARTLANLPNDTLIWIITGFLNAPFQPIVRLVCRRFNSIVTSACVVWYRRVPHTVFISHLTHRIRQETDAVKKAQERSMELSKRGYIDPEQFQHRIPSAARYAVPDPDVGGIDNNPDVTLPPDMDPNVMLVVPHNPHGTGMPGSGTTLPASATANINLWLEEEQEAGGIFDGSDDVDESGLCQELLTCHTFNDMMGNQLQFLFNSSSVDTPDDRDRWFLQTCVKGCCHREWAAFLAACHEKDHHVSQLQEHARVGSAICRAFMFPASRVPAVVIALIVTTYLCLVFFALMAWAGISTPPVQFGPLWAFFILLFPLLYIFFGASTIEPMVLSFLGFVGFTFSAVLVYFYRVVSPFKAMSWISCSTPLLLCMSCCATYSFLMLHRLSEEVTQWRHRMVTLAACSLPAFILLFATLVALELDGTIAVYVPGYSAPSPPTPTSAPGQQQTSAPDAGWSAGNTGLSGNLNCGGTLRFSAVAAAIVMLLLSWVSSVALNTFPFATMHAKLPATSTSLLCFHIAFVTGILAALSGFIQDAACYPSAITFAFAMLAMIAMCVAQCFSVVSSTVLKDHTLIPGIADMDLLTLVDSSGVDLAFSTQEVALLLAPNHEDPTLGDTGSVTAP